MSNRNSGNSLRRAALIGGSGFAHALDSEFPEGGVAQLVSTTYGQVNAKLYTVNESSEIVFLARHGSRHSIPPHRIDHRANLQALADLGVTHVLATSAVGSLRRELDSGAMVVLDDFVDLRGGVTTLFDAEGRVRHTDFSQPFSEELRIAVLEESASLATEWLDAPIVYPAGTYLCLNGPRYETPAEVRLFASWGLDVVGMTVAPEAILARELDLEYCNVSIVTNLGTGLSTGALSHSEVEAQMAKSRPFLLAVLIRTLRRVLGK